MRWCVSIGTMIVVGAIAAGDVAGVAAPGAKSQQADTKDNLPTVDVELVIAVDVSYSMDLDELAVQREGYAQVIVSEAFLQAIKTGPNQKVAVTYFEWSKSSDQKIIIPWRVIDGPESAAAVADEIMKAPVRRGASTSISGAINFAIPLFEQNPDRGLRRVIDISGNGPNNNGAPVTAARDAALEKGITINAMPTMIQKPIPSDVDIADLDLYYEDCVIGGPGSFVVPNKAQDTFTEAIRTKLILEVAGRTPEHVAPAGDKQPRISCLIGEKMWEDHFRRLFESGSTPQSPDVRCRFVGSARVSELECKKLTRPGGRPGGSGTARGG